MIIIDTNVLLAALVSSQGYSFRLLELILNGKVSYLLNPTLLFEYRSVLMRMENLVRIPLNAKEIENLLAVLVQGAHVQSVYYRWRPNLQDPNDDFLIELAVAGQAESIVTFNKKDFTQAELKFDLLIETPKEFLKRRRLS